MLQNYHLFALLHTLFLTHNLLLLLSLLYIRLLGPAPHSKMSKLCYDQWSVGQDVLVWSSQLGPKTRFLLLSDSCGFVDVGCPLWWEDGSVIYNWCWPLPTQLFLCVSPAGLQLYFAVPDPTLSQPGGPGPCIYIPQEEDGPVIPPRHWVPFSPPPTTRRDIVEVFEPTSMWGPLLPNLVGQLNCCWPLPAQLFLPSVSLRSMTKIFILS
jgi:hypothetical protein